MKILPLFISILLLSNTSFAQQPKQTNTKPTALDSLVEALDEWSFDLNIDKKKDTSASAKANQAECIKMFMSQFDETEKAYWDGKIKQYGSPMADSLGLWLNRLQTNNFMGIEKPNAVPLFGADKMNFYDGKYYGGEPFEDGAYIQLRYEVNNKNCNKIYKEIKKAYAIFIKDPAFKFSYDNGTSGKILKNNLPVLDYAFFEDKNGLGGTKLFFDIQNPKFPKIFMLNESDKSNISSIIKDTDKPQIWEVKGYNNGEWYQRYNGIFKDGILVKGSKSFKGYSNFYDGTWYSQKWGDKDWAHTQVLFFPSNTNDTVWGAFNDLDMNVFSEDSRYSSKVKNERYIPETPKWITEVYSKLYQNDNQAQHDNIARKVIRKTDQDHLGLGKRKEEELAAINGMQKNLVLLIGIAAMGFESYEKGEKEKNNGSIFYYSRQNSLMLSNEEVIESVGAKTNYIAAYKTPQTRDISMQAFLALPSTNKSSSTLKLEQEKNIDATEVQQFNLYMADKLVASYAKYLKQELSVIKVYQLSF